MIARANRSPARRVHLNFSAVEPVGIEECPCLTLPGVLRLRPEVGPPLHLIHLSAQKRNSQRSTYRMLHSLPLWERRMTYFPPWSLLPSTRYGAMNIHSLW